MTLTIFLGSLMLAMAIGIPISFALLVSGVALMWHLDMFEAQILRRTCWAAPTTTRYWPCPSSCWPARS